MVPVSPPTTDAGSSTDDDRHSGPLRTLMTSPADTFQLDSWRESRLFDLKCCMPSLIFTAITTRICATTECIKLYRVFFIGLQLIFYRV
jgi:hypothetical protein